LTSDLAIGATKDLFTNRNYADTAVGAWAFDVSPKDGRFLMLKEQADGTPSPISVVVNWFDELGHMAAR
jgi:hypothetical protein